MVSCRSQSEIPYILNKPDAVLRLPAELNEVSGLTDIDSRHVAFVQDEIGTVFVYDLLDDVLTAEYPFDSSGDFEGLSFTGKSMFILRSDGRLSEIRNFGTGSTEREVEEPTDSVVHYSLPVITDDNEGLCHDLAGDRLLIAAKSKPRDKGRRSERLIYAFDLENRRLQEHPTYSIRMEELEAAAADRGIVSQAKTSSGKVKSLNFRPSSLAVHPLSGEIYIISAEDFLLVVIDRQGAILHVEQLPDTLFAKAEGISFLSDGRMLITNEAMEGPATLLVFNYRE